MYNYANLLVRKGEESVLCYPEMSLEVESVECSRCGSIYSVVIFPKFNSISFKLNKV
jgi:hypothetical protein